MSNLFVSKEAAMVLDELYGKLKTVGDQEISFKIDNNEPNSGIMAVHLEKRAGWKNGRAVFSVAHYYEQNGDLMADPLMEFLRIPAQNNEPVKFIATFFQQDGLFATRRDSVLLNPDTGVPEKYSKKASYQDRVFATQWMRNIAWQQKLECAGKVKVH